MAAARTETIAKFAENNDMRVIRVTADQVHTLARFNGRLFGMNFHDVQSVINFSQNLAHLAPEHGRTIKRELKDLRDGPRLAVHPATVTEDAALAMMYELRDLTERSFRARVNMVLDASVAFLEPNERMTVQQCLEWIERHKIG